MLQTKNGKLPTTMSIYKPKGNLHSVAIMIEVTSRRMECTLLTPDFSQVPAVALQYFFTPQLYAPSIVNQSPANHAVKPLCSNQVEQEPGKTRR